MDAARGAGRLLRLAQRVGLVAVCAVVCLVVCAGPQASAHAQNHRDQSSDTSRTLRVAIPKEVSSLTPYGAVPETLLELVYDRLASPSPYFANAEPWLARSITPEGTDGRTWRIEIRDDVHWQDGMPFTAADVAFTFRYYRDGPSNRWTHHVNHTPHVETIEQVGPTSVRVTCAQPCPLFDKVTAADLPMLPAHLWRGVADPHRYQGPIVGTGPYRLESIASGRYVKLRANDDYFGGRPLIDEIVAVFIRQPATAFAALYSGEVDLVVVRVPPEWIDHLARRQDVRLAPSPMPLQAVELRLNFNRPPFDDHAFRRALTAAVDTEEIVERVALGHGLPGRVGLPLPGTPWTAPGLAQPSDDPPAARRALDELGFRDRDGDGVRESPAGVPLRFGLKVSSSEPVLQRVAQVVERQLAAVGVEAHLEVVDPARLSTLWASGHFDLMVAEMSSHGLVDPDQWMQSHIGGYMWTDGVPYPALDTVIADWWAAETPQARLDASFAMQRVHASAPTLVMLYFPEVAQAYRPQAFDDYLALPGMGVFHKWSLLEFRDGLPGWAQP